jgi:hypothetical protein
MSDNKASFTDPADRERFKVMIDEIVVDMRAQATHAEHIKEVISLAKTEFGLKPKVVRTLAKAAFKSDFNEVRDEYNEIVELYETVMTN